MDAAGWAAVGVAVMVAAAAVDLLTYQPTRETEERPRMGYAITVIIHEDGYTPAGPSTEDVDLRRSVKLYDTSSLRRTEIHYDDSEAVPAGTAQELDRWNMPVSMADQNRWTIERQAEDIAMPRLTEIRGECNTIIADQNITNAEAVAYIQALAAHNNDVALYLRKLIRLVVRLLDAAD